MARTCTMDDLRKQPSSIIDQARSSKEPIFIEQAGAASTLIIDADAYLTDMQALAEFKRIYSDDVKGKPTDIAMDAAAKDAGAAPSDDAVEASKAGAKTAWRCTICGYIVYMDELPEDFVCPVCGVGREMFEKVED